MLMDTEQMNVPEKELATINKFARSVADRYLCIMETKYVDERIYLTLALPGSALVGSALNPDELLSRLGLCQKKCRLSLRKLFWFECLLNRRVLKNLVDGFITHRWIAH